MRLSDLQNKNIVNVNDGRNIGSIIDVNVDEVNGNIISFIIEPNKNVFKLFGKSSSFDSEIQWKSIVKIGEDVILVKVS